MFSMNRNCSFCVGDPEGTANRQVLLAVPIEISDRYGISLSSYTDFRGAAETAQPISQTDRDGAWGVAVWVMVGNSQVLLAVTIEISDRYNKRIRPHAYFAGVRETTGEICSTR